MDESHLNAPTVHGNTADLPTALASIIGLASMETRVDHGEPGSRTAAGRASICRRPSTCAAGSTTDSTAYPWRCVRN
jgi:hypothetical protein